MTNATDAGPSGRYGGGTVVGDTDSVGAARSRPLGTRDRAGFAAAIRAAALAALAAALLLCLPAAATGATPPLLDQDAVVAPPPPGAAPGATDDPGTGTTTTPPPPPSDTTTVTTPVAPPPPPVLAPPPVAPEVLRGDPGAGAAAAQSSRGKRLEAQRACASQRPPINRMLAIGGVIGAGEGSAWARVALFVAACFAAIGATAFIIRRRSARRHHAPVAARGALETVSALVAIVGTLIAIGDQFVTESPPPQVAMTVRDVLPRITKAEYARRTGASVAAVSRIDRREVGNVVLLEIRLEGYEGRRLDLDYATYSLDRNVSGTLLSATERRARLRVVDEDVQTSFVPIWIGYPKSRRFEAQFRLIEDEQIRQLTNAGPMKGSSYRYACARDVRAL